MALDQGLKYRKIGTYNPRVVGWCPVENTATLPVYNPAIKCRVSSYVDALKGALG